MNDNCFVEIKGESYPGILKSIRGNVYDVQMAGKCGYDYVINNMNTSGKILMTKTGVSYSFSVISSFDQDKLTISFM